MESSLRDRGQRSTLEDRPTELRLPAMLRRLEFLIATLRAALAWSRPLTAMGVLGVVLGAVCLR